VVWRGSYAMDEAAFLHAASSMAFVCDLIRGRRDRAGSAEQIRGRRVLSFGARGR